MTPQEATTIIFDSLYKRSNIEDPSVRVVIEHTTRLAMIQLINDTFQVELDHIQLARSDWNDYYSKQATLKSRLETIVFGYYFDSVDMFEEVYDELIDISYKLALEVYNEPLELNNIFKRMWFKNSSNGCTFSKYGLF